MIASIEAIRFAREEMFEQLRQGQLDLFETVRVSRKALGLSQKEFAKLVQLPQPLISQLERGLGNPTYATLQAIAKPFKLKLGFMPPR